MLRSDCVDRRLDCLDALRVSRVLVDAAAPGLEARRLPPDDLSPLLLPPELLERRELLSARDALRLARSSSPPVEALTAPGLETLDVRPLLARSLLCWSLALRELRELRPVELRLLRLTTALSPCPFLGSSLFLTHVMHALMIELSRLLCA